MGRNIGPSSEGPSVSIAEDIPTPEAVPPPVSPPSGAAAPETLSGASGRRAMLPSVSVGMTQGFRRRRIILSAVAAGVLTGLVLAFLVPGLFFSPRAPERRDGATAPPPPVEHVLVVDAGIPSVRRDVSVTPAQPASSWDAATSSDVPLAMDDASFQETDASHHHTLSHREETAEDRTARLRVEQGRRSCCLGVGLSTWTSPQGTQHDCPPQNDGARRALGCRHH